MDHMTRLALLRGRFEHYGEFLCSYCFVCKFSFCEYIINMTTQHMTVYILVLILRICMYVCIKINIYIVMVVFGLFSTIRYHVIVSAKLSIHNFIIIFELIQLND